MIPLGFKTQPLLKPDGTWPLPPKLKPGVPCRHNGCIGHVSHPCEKCGRVLCGVYDEAFDKYHSEPLFKAMVDLQRALLSAEPTLSRHEQQRAKSLAVWLHEQFGAKR